MIVGVKAWELQLAGCRSLKDKRRVIKSLKDRLHARFNVSVAEVDSLDSWQRAVLGVAMVGNDGKFLASALSKVVDHARNFRFAELADYHIEIF